MKKSFVFHPLLFTIYAILAPVATNVTVAGAAAIKSLFTSLIMAAVIIAMVRWVEKDKVKAGLIASGILASLLSYGHVVSLVSKALGASNLVIDSVVSLSMLGLLAGWIYFVRRKLANPLPVNNYLNIVGFILIVFPLYQIFVYTQQADKIKNWANQYRQQVWAENGVVQISAGKDVRIKPGTDIYYIILDGYAREDVLRDLYQYDNSAFIRALRERGFYVADQSRANYMETVFSISSSLNMSHLGSAQAFTRQNTTIREREPFRDLMGFTIGQNRVIEFLRNNGFEIAQFESSYGRLKFDQVDQLMESPHAPRMNPEATFEMMMVNTTVGNIYFKLRGKDYVPMQSLYDQHRERVMYTFEHLPDFADQPESQFIYAHVVSPHPPYVFGPNGEPRRMAEPFTLLDSNPNDEWKPDLYRDQVTFITKEALKMIDQILAKSDPKPIIILQADHSSRTYAATDRSVDVNMQLLFPILNAYYLPDAQADQVVYPNITPVNTFRTIFNYYFDTNLPLVEDTSYTAEYDNGLIKFVDACKSYNACPDE